MNTAALSKRFTAFLVGGAAIAMIATTLSPVPAEAAAVRDRAAEIADFEQALVQNRLDELPASEREAAVRRAALDDHRTSSGATLDGSTATVLANGSGSVVRIGLKGAGLETISSRSSFFDAAGRLTTTVEFAFRGDGEGGGSLEVWQDRELRFSKSITAAEAEKSVALAAQQSRASAGFRAKLNDCLSKQNVNAWALAILAGVCGAACIVTAGTACAVCIGASIGFPTGVVASCVVRASQ